VLIAAFERDGREHVVVGLSDENIRRLRNDEPIRKVLEGVPGLPDGTILFILGPEDTARFVARHGPDAP
jgi:hypothetical protein